MLLFFPFQLHINIPFSYTWSYAWKKLPFKHILALRQAFALTIFVYLIAQFCQTLAHRCFNTPVCITLITTSALWNGWFKSLRTFFFLCQSEVLYEWKKGSWIINILMHFLFSCGVVFPSTAGKHLHHRRCWFRLYKTRLPSPRPSYSHKDPPPKHTHTHFPMTLKCAYICYLSSLNHQSEAAKQLQLLILPQPPTSPAAC